MCLSGWWCNNHLEKYEFVNGKDDIPYMKWKIKTCSKPPTSYVILYLFHLAGSSPGHGAARFGCNSTANADATRITMALELTLRALLTRRPGES